MRQFRTHTHFLRPIATLLLAISLHGCTKWNLLPEPKALAARPRGTVRVTTDRDARHLIVKNPTISGDSIVWNDPQHGGIPLNDVEWVEARTFDPVANGFFVLVGIAFLGAVVLRQ